MRIEHWFYTVPLRWRSLLRRRQVDQELDEELQYHLQRKVDEYIAQGLTPDEARHAAMRDMDGLQQRKEECRDMRRLNIIDNLLYDLRYAARMLGRNPGFAMVAILSLALAIGANAAIFSLIDSLLLRRLPVSDPERLVSMFIRGEQPRPHFTFPLFDAIRNRNDVFSQTFAWSEHDFQAGVGGDVVHVPGVLASGDYFPALGVAASVGRTFTVADDTPDGGANGPVAVISDSFWSRQFQRDPNAVGRPIVLDKVHFTIVGIMPRGFFGAQVGAEPEIWAPLQLASRIDDPGCIASRSCWWLVIMGRLKPGITEQQAAAQLRVISPAIMKDTLPPAWIPAGQGQVYLHFELGVVPGATGWTDLRTQFSRPLEILMMLVGLVLLIACSNMANLLLARSTARHREIAIRLAMGAGRARVIRQLLTESIFISVIGAAAGFLFARWAVRLLISILSTKNNPVLLNLSPDWRVLLFTASAAIATGLMFGLIPALQTTRFGISAALKERTHNVRQAGGRMGIGRVLLAGQVALSVLLAASAGLFAGSLIRLISLNPGFNP